MTNTWPAERIKALRATLELSQEALAQKLGLSVSAVSKLEQAVNSASGPTQKLLDLIERKIV